jgi:hypothetical protein
MWERCSPDPRGLMGFHGVGVPSERYLSLYSPSKFKVDGSGVAQ